MSSSRFSRLLSRAGEHSTEVVGPSSECGPMDKAGCNEQTLTTKPVPTFDIDDSSDSGASGSPTEPQPSPPVLPFIASPVRQIGEYDPSRSLKSISRTLEVELDAASTITTMTFDAAGGISLPLEENVVIDSAGENSVQRSESDDASSEACQSGQIDQDGDKCGDVTSESQAVADAGLTAAVDASLSINDTIPIPRSFRMEPISRSLPLDENEVINSNGGKQAQLSESDCISFEASSSDQNDQGGDKCCSGASESEADAGARLTFEDQTKSIDENHHAITMTFGDPGFASFGSKHEQDDDDRDNTIEESFSETAEMPGIPLNSMSTSLDADSNFTTSSPAAVEQALRSSGSLLDGSNVFRAVEDASSTNKARPGLIHVLSPPSAFTTSNSKGKISFRSSSLRKLPCLIPQGKQNKMYEFMDGDDDPQEPQCHSLVDCDLLHGNLLDDGIQGFSKQETRKQEEAVDKASDTNSTPCPYAPQDEHLDLPQILHSLEGTGIEMEHFAPFSLWYEFAFVDLDSNEMETSGLLDSPCVAIDAQCDAAVAKNRIEECDDGSGCDKQSESPRDSPNHWSRAIASTLFRKEKKKFTMNSPVHSSDVELFCESKTKKKELVTMKEEGEKEKKESKSSTTNISSVNEAIRSSTNDLTIFLEDTPAADPTFKIYVLLLQPQMKIFELIQILYCPSSATIGDLLELIPVNSKEDILAKQAHIGLCRLKDNGCASVHTDLDVLASGKAKGGTANIRRGDILVAIPEGYTGEKCKKMAKSILAKKQFRKLLSKSDPFARKKRRRQNKKQHQKSSLSGKSNDSHLSSIAETDCPSIESEPGNEGMCK